MLEGILDLVTMIIVLALVVGMSFSLILPLVNTDTMAYNQEVQDKGVVKDIRGGEVQGTSAEPEPVTMNAREIVLMMHVQDENMPQPRKIRVENESIIPITSTYKIEVIEIARQVWKDLPSKPNGRYIVRYDHLNGGVYKIERK